MAQVEQIGLADHNVNDACGCLLCGAGRTHRINALKHLQLVSSDCQPIGAGFSLQVCDACGHVQRHMDDHWREAVDSIYSRYDFYAQSGGREQVKFGGGQALSRSRRILNATASYVQFADNGRLLDVGCANGELLRTFGELNPHWQLMGAELNERYREQVLKIPGVTDFYTGDVESIDATFDLITLCHVLEHVPAPGDMLQKLADRLRSDGRILIQVPNLAENPLDLLVADHCSHFTPATLVRVAGQTGLHVEAVATDWVAKEVGLLLSKKKPDRQPTVHLETCDVSYVEQSVSWLRGMVKDACAIAKKRPLGVFGTTNAGTWLASELGKSAKFFVDEDELRIGREHIGLQIHSPETMPDGSSVYLALPMFIAEEIFERLQPRFENVAFVCPRSPAEHLSEQSSDAA